MGYVKRIVCLANSFKTGGSCVAGREVLGDDFGGWVRPVSARPTAEVSPSESRYDNRTSPKLLDIVDVALLKPDPRHHQRENHVIDASQRWTKVGELPWSALTHICDHPKSLWINSGHTKGPDYYDCISQVEAESLDHSLLLIKPDDLSIEVGPHYYTRKRAYRARFHYRGTYYNMSLTDPVATNAYSAKGDGSYVLEDAYLCISLTEPYAKDNRCHKLVAAIIRDAAL